MGVHYLWKLLATSAHPVNVSELSGLKVAIDTSIWMLKILNAQSSLESG